MDKKTVSYFKKQFPIFFFWIVKNPALAWFACELDRFRYIYHMLTKKPYFGTIALAGQIWEERKNHMINIVKQEIHSKNKEEFNLLEIGSWAGESAVLWANSIKSAKCKGTIVCVDPWEPYINEKLEHVNTATIIMNHFLKKNKILKLFLHNIKTTGNSDMVLPIKGKSDSVLKFLKKNSFDLVYIDGDHAYSKIKTDLQNASLLVVDGGILSGDDFDLTIDQIDQEYAEKNKESNIIIDPKTNKAFHPGVTLALAEFFNIPISKYNGFWIMRKKSNSWEQIIL